MKNEVDAGAVIARLKAQLADLIVDNAVKDALIEQLSAGNEATETDGDVRT